ncbi:ABC transporter substrate-binding protein [Nocardioides carbamazepini]|uniref:ABC transporter substrate-binding protein n=1 Tax=Nocardioides carbamazepini TaxID=2854259 RepID=UPI00214A7681|nr:ABC transporter substrate-binding protein [Nocardioides carbamazepini]MCR1785643.1 ABC transporter substrate-binding protein [Nocardioides carbamazepini]
MVAASALLAACGGSDAGGDSGVTKGSAKGEPINIGWLTDATSVTRGTYYPEYEGARLFFSALNDAGGINDRPVDLLMRDMKIDQQLAVTSATDLVEGEEVLMLAGGTVEGLLPAVFDVVRSNDVAFLSGHSARPDMFPEAPDPLLFSVGNVFEAMSDARVKVWPELMSQIGVDGGKIGCYIHQAPASEAVCNRWMEEQVAQNPEFTEGPIVNAPLETTDFTSYARTIANGDPAALFDISIASHAIGVAVASRNVGYEGPIVFSMTATPETDIKQVAEQTNGENLHAISNITSVSETQVPEIEKVLAAAEKYGTDIEPSSATVNGWLMGMTIADALERCGEDCDRAGLRDALEGTDLDTAGLTGGPLTFSPTDHTGKRYWTAYSWDPAKGELVRAIDEWIEFDPATDLVKPLA